MTKNASEPTPFRSSNVSEGRSEAAARTLLGRFDYQSGAAVEIVHREMAHRTIAGATINAFEIVRLVDGEPRGTTIFTAVHLDILRRALRTYDARIGFQSPAQHRDEAGEVEA